MLYLYNNIHERKHESFMLIYRLNECGHFVVHLWKNISDNFTYNVTHGVGKLYIIANRHTNGYSHPDGDLRPTGIHVTAFAADTEILKEFAVHFI